MKERDWKANAMKLADNRIITCSGETMCSAYRAPLERCDDAKQAIRLWKNCVDWALQEQYPSKGEILAMFDDETLVESGVYVNKEFNGERIDGHICCVFIGCTGRISTGLNLQKEIIPTLYLSDGCDMDVEVDENLTFPVSVKLFYGSKVREAGIGRLIVKDLNHLRVEDNTDAVNDTSEPDLTGLEDL